MVGKAGLKAGLIGILVIVVWSLFAQLVLTLSGVLACASSGVSALLYAGIGVLAGFFLAVPRTAGNGAKAGAIAGVVSGFVGSLVGTAVLAITVATVGSVPNLAPEQMEALAELGWGLWTIVAISGAIGVPCGMAIGAGAAAVGGAVFSAIVPD